MISRKILLKWYLENTTNELKRIICWSFYFLPCIFELLYLAEILICVRKRATRLFVRATLCYYIGIKLYVLTLMAELES